MNDEKLSSNGLEILSNGNNSTKVVAVKKNDSSTLYEIDLHKGENQINANKDVDHKRSEINNGSTNSQRNGKPSKLRYLIMCIALISPFVVTYSKSIINFAITDMIDPSCFVNRHNSTQLNRLYFEEDNSCPVDEQVRLRLIDGNQRDIKRALNSVGEKFKWDEFKQGQLKGAFSIGHTLFQIPGSRLSEIYGSHLIMSISSLMIAACCLSAPFMAQLHFYLIFVDLLTLGIFCSFMTPALITLFSNWLTPGEKSAFMSSYLIASRLGSALTALICGYLIEAHLSWRYVFYSAGGVSLFFCSIFFLLARSKPIDHPFISNSELEYLSGKNLLVRESLKDKIKKNTIAPSFELNASSLNNDLRNPDKIVVADVDDRKTPKEIPKVKPPWLAILTSAPVWAFVITKFCVKLSGDLVQIELPNYLNRVMHYSPKDNAWVNAWSYIAFCTGCFVAGVLVKYTVKKRPFGLSKTAIRKLFQSFASFGVALVYLGIAASICDQPTTQVLLILLFFTTTFGTGGEAQIPLDITERYSGTIHAIGSTLAFSGAIMPTFVGLFTRDHSADQDRWRMLWIAASGIAFTGGIVFLLLGDAKVQSFDSTSVENDVEGGNDKKSRKNLDGKFNEAYVQDIPPNNDIRLNDNKTFHNMDQSKESKVI